MATRTLVMYEVPAGTQRSSCKGALLGGSCTAPVYWIKDPDTGRARIIDCDCEGGRRPSMAVDERQLDLLSGGTSAVYPGLGCDHHATCPDVERFRRGPEP